LASAMLICGAFTAAAGASTAVPEPIAEVNPIVFEPFSSEHISSWTPLLSRTSYGVSVTFMGLRSGTIEVELQNSSGQRVTGFTESFTNRVSLTVSRNRTTAAGTYRIVIRVTISNQTTVRTSAWFRI
jgi:hypothetical protein